MRLKMSGIDIPSDLNWLFTLYYTSIEFPRREREWTDFMVPSFRSAAKIAVSVA